MSLPRRGLKSVGLQIFGDESWPRKMSNAYGSSSPRSGYVCSPPGTEASFTPARWAPSSGVTKTPCIFWPTGEATRTTKCANIRGFASPSRTPEDRNTYQYLGRAEVSFDRSKIKELWSIPAKVWWDSPDDPNICVIKVTPEEAEFWDAHGTLLSNVKMAIALATGSHLDAGEHGKTPM